MIEYNSHDLEAASRAASALDPDLEQYRADLAEFNLTEEQETELLQTLWSIMYTFVEMGFSGNISEHLFEAFNAVSKDNPQDDK